ncbi:MAG TPA: DUF692 domain-containing protein [Candidatus Angelobacter sp.]|nr:DUF692 domain-containing protein [Candidatus Angelobacter sp.]
MIWPTERLGVGLGYRPELSEDIDRHPGEVDFVEFTGDHCFNPSLMTKAKALSRRMPGVCHFLSLSIGTAEPLDEEYTEKVAEVLLQLQPPWFSDHLAVTRVQGVDLGHLSPVAFTEETVEIVSRKAIYLQERFGLPFLLENITSHFTLPGASLTEWDLLTKIVERSGCGILLDVNNVYVNAFNAGFDPYDFLRGIPLDRVLQIHLGGAVMRDGVMIDSHGHPVPDPVYDLLEFVCDNSPVSAILLERDRNMPAFEELAGEMRRARSILNGSRKDEGAQAKARLV